MRSPTSGTKCGSSALTCTWCSRSSARSVSVNGYSNDSPGKAAGIVPADHLGLGAPALAEQLALRVTPRISEGRHVRAKQLQLEYSRGPPATDARIERLPALLTVVERLSPSLPAGRRPRSYPPASGCCTSRVLARSTSPSCRWSGEAEHDEELPAATAIVDPSRGDPLDGCSPLHACRKRAPRREKSSLDN